MPRDDVSRVRAFFEGALPAVMAHRGEAFDRSAGSLALHIDGCGSWVIRFGDHTSAQALVEEASLDADCVAVFTTAAFALLLDGKAPRPAPAVVGDVDMLQQLGLLLLGPAKGGLGARLMSC